MNKLTLSLTLLAAALGANSAMANTSGVVHVSGYVQGQTCKITDATNYHNLILPDTRTAELGQRGAYSSQSVDFRIELEQCDKGKTAGVVFDMTNVDASNRGTLKNLYDGLPGAAKNVNIQLLSDGSAMNLAHQNKRKYQKAQTYIDVLQFDYSARYYATGQSAEGFVGTSAIFNVDYK